MTRYRVFNIKPEKVRAPYQVLDPEGHLVADEAPLSDDEAIAGLRAMLLGRRFDEHCIKLQRRGLMVTFAPGIGQEACSVGSVMAMDSERDWFVPQYREAAGVLLHGYPLVRGYLWHMGSPLGFDILDGLHKLPFQAAVAGQIPHAVGLGWGLKLQGKDDVVVVHFGDGASSHGDFYEPANFAGVTKAPVVFFCQNNHWAISTPATIQTAAHTKAQKAVAFGFPGVLVDGNDLFAVYEVTRDAVARARQGDGPTLIEGLTYRLGIHTTADAGTRFEPRELRESWEPKDPLIRVRKYLERKGKWSEEVEREMEEEIEAQLEEAWAEAQTVPKPTLEESVEHMFAQPERGER
jgi:pyruvate dehydrogenase E1 component alpha subunit